MLLSVWVGGNASHGALPQLRHPKPLEYRNSTTLPLWRAALPGTADWSSEVLTQPGLP